MSLEHVLLGMLRTPLSGYDLKKEFEDGARHYWHAELSQIYPTLKRMTKREWLTCDSAVPRRGRERLVYRRTPKGTLEFHDWLRSGPESSRERISHVAQLISLGELDDLDATSTFLDRLRVQFQWRADFLAKAANELHSASGASTSRMNDSEFHEYLSLRMGVAASRARAESCRDALELVRARQTELSKYAES